MHIGFDTLEWNYAIAEDELAFTLPLIEEIFLTGERTIGDDRVVVTRVGGVQWRWCLHLRDGVRICFPEEGKAQYGLRIIAGSLLCLTVADLEAFAVAFLARMLIKDEAVIRSSLLLSRLDVCTDIELPANEFARMCKLVALDDERVVCRARHVEMFRSASHFTGFAVGKSDVRLRVYDKHREATQKGDWDSCWSVVYGHDQGAIYTVPDGFVVARFEWQLRGKFLRSCKSAELDGVRSVTDFERLASSILGYLCGDWFKFAALAAGADHERRLLPFWRSIRAAFTDGAWSAWSDSFRRDLARSVSTNVHRLMAMAAGCLATVAAVVGLGDGDQRPKSSGFVVGCVEKFLRDNRDKFIDSAEQRYRALSYGMHHRVHLAASGGTSV